MLVGVAGLAWGYGDLPSTFDATTGYVTLTGSDNVGAANQSFFLPVHWSDNQAPHPDTNYYVKAGWCLGTPHQNSDVTAQLAIDPDCQTFKGRTLVIAGYLWHLNGTYDFAFPDLRMLPNTYISYTAIKTPLSGTMTVYGTESQPTCLRSNLGDIYQQPFGMDIKGDSSSCLAIYNSDKPTWYKLQGNLSEFYGVLSAGHPSNAEATGSYGFHVTSDHVAGTVALPRKKASLCVTSANGLSVGGLRVTEKETRLFLDGSQLSSSTPRLTVTNSLEVTGWAYVMLHTPRQGSSNKLAFDDYVAPAEADDKILIRLEPEVVRKGGWNGELDELFRLPHDAANLASSSLRWRDDVDGGKSLLLVTCVAHTTVGDTNSRGSLASPTLTDGGTDYFWSNESYPTDDTASGYSSTKTIYTPTGGSYAFPGRLLLLVNAQIYMFASSYGFVCDDFEWRAGGINASISVGDPAGPVRKDENGTTCNCCDVRGKIRVPAGFMNTLQSYGARTVIRIESDLIGGGDMTVQTINYAGDYKNDKGFVEFAACNTNFTGKVKVSTADNTTKYANLGIVVPNWEQRVSLFVSDERNLGGARDEFAWDALYLDQYSDLCPLNDVTFTDGWNRGIAIGNIGRINVPSNLTLTVWRPLNVNGNLVKEGNGTLALGGTLTFGGAAQSATPTAGANLLTAMGGFVKPLATNAFDGLAITFTNNAALKVDGAPADAGLLKYGLVNVKEATAPIVLAPNQATLPVTVDFGAATEPPAVQWTVGLVTLATAKAEALKPQMVLSNPAPFTNWRGTLGLVDNGDGTSTIVVNYKTVGLTILFR